MSRQGAAAKARDRRHRAAVALRSKTSERSAADGTSSTSASENDHAGQGLEPVAVDGSASSPRALAPPLKARPRRTLRRGADFDLDPLRDRRSSWTGAHYGSEAYFVSWPTSPLAVKEPAARTVRAVREAAWPASRGSCDLDAGLGL